MDQPLRLRPQDRHRLPGRDARDRPSARASGRARRSARADRPRDRGHAGADGGGLRRRSPTAASGCSRTSSTGSARQAQPTCAAAADPHAPRRAPGAEDDGGRRHRGHRRGGAASGLHGRRQDRDRGQARPERRLLDDQYVASFVGLVPATNPRLVILVTIDEPAARSGAASLRLRRSSRSQALTCNIWKSRPTLRRR